MRNTLRSKLFVLGLGALAAFSLVLASLPASFLQFSSTHFTCTLTQPSFQLRWLHSVEKELWIENYRISGQELLLTATQFKTFGAGTPSTGADIKNKDGWLHQQVQRSLPGGVNWVVSRNVESTVFTALGAWPIYQDVDDYSEIQIQVMRLPRWHYFIQESCDDHFRNA